MRRVAGVVLIGVGTFLLVLAVLLPTVGAAKSKKTPLDLNITQISSGTAKLLDAATGKTTAVQLRATRIVRTDSTASDGTNTTVDESLCIVVVVGTTPNCLRANNPRLLSLSTDRVTADRKSAESVHVAKYGENVNGDTSVRHVGLSYKWPIDAQKKTYQFFSPDLKKAFPATYAGTDTIRGLAVYKYVSVTGDQPYKVQGTFPGTYNDTRTVWVEPRTGAILKGSEHQVQTIDGTPKAVALDTTLTFDKSAIDYQAKYAQDKIGQLRLAQLWAPLIAGIVGVIALVLGIILLRSRRGATGNGGGEHGGQHRNDGPPPDGGPNYGDPNQRDPGYAPTYSGNSQT